MARTKQAKDILLERRESLKTISENLLKRETIEREQFEALLQGKAEEEVFGDEAPPVEGRWDADAPQACRPFRAARARGEWRSG
jgi:cell division protease FtsH